MRCLVLLSLLAAVAYAAPGPHREPPLFADTAEGKACYEALKPAGGREEMKATIDTCIAEQEGLEVVVADLVATKALEKGTRPRGGGGPPGGKRGGRRHHGPGGGPKGNPIRLLEDAGKTDEALALKKCVATAKGFIADGTDVIDVAAVKADILAKVSGTDSETNTQLGLDSCPEDSLTNFDLMEYKKCVMTYCATGAAPEAAPEETA